MPYQQLPRSEIDKLLYVEKPPADGRNIYLLPFRNAQGQFVVPFVMGETIGLLNGSPAAASYVAPELEDASQDLDVPLLGTVVRHLSFPGLDEAYHKLERDLLNTGAFIEKYFVLHGHYGRSHDHAYASVLTSEFEGAIVNARALYDQLQFFLRALWSLVVQERKQKLPDSFDKLAKCSAEDLFSKYRLPRPLIRFVTTSSAVFCALRDLRVDIEHHGKSQTGFFLLDEGFAVDVSQYPWKQFDVWAPESLINSKLGSYLTFLAALANEVFGMVEMLDVAIRTAIPLPEAITSQGVYLRSPVLRHVRKLDHYLAHPWLPAAAG